MENIAKLWERDKVMSYICKTFWNLGGGIFRMAAHLCCIHYSVHTGSQHGMWLAMNPAVCERFVSRPCQGVKFFQY